MDAGEVFFFATAIALSFLYSLRQNPRRLELLTYPLWMVVVGSWFHGLEDVFLVAPQFPLYTSPKDTQDPDKTISDSQARGVFVDACIIMPLVDFQERKTESIMQFLQTCFRARRLDHRHLKVDQTIVAVGVENKRAPTRSPADIEAYAQSIGDVLKTGQRQSMSQAHILFCSPKFSKQETVLLVAAGGEFWSIRAHSRENAQRKDSDDFRMNLLQVISRMYDETYESGKNKDDDDDDEELELEGPGKGKEKPGNHFPGDPDLVAPNEATTAFQQGRESHEKIRKLRIDGQAEAREKRAKKRKEMQGASNKKLQDYNTFIQRAGAPSEDASSPLYSDEDLEAFWKLRWESKAKMKRRQEYQPFFEPVPKSTPTIHDLLRGWTRPLRLYTAASDAYERAIKSYLKDLADKERIRRRQLAPQK